MQFLISMHINPAVLDALTDEEKAAIGEGHGAFLEALKKSGELITTQALADPSQAAVVSVRNGQPVVTDGPFLESKEYLGGFYLIDCENKERAIELAVPAYQRLEDLRRELTQQVLDGWGRHASNFPSANITCRTSTPRPSIAASGICAASSIARSLLSQSIR